MAVTNNEGANVHTSPYAIDVIKKSLRDTILETTIPSDKLIEVISVIERYNVSTFILDGTIEQVFNMLVKIHGGQDIILDLMTEFKYRLGINGVVDEDLPMVISNSLSFIYKSTLIPDDYKSSIARISKDSLNDVFVCLLYLFRMNIVYAGRCVETKINKEQLNEKR